MTEVVNAGPCRTTPDHAGPRRTTPVHAGTNHRITGSPDHQAGPHHRTTAYIVSVGESEYNVEVGETGLWVNGEPVAFELASLNGNGLHLFRRPMMSTGGVESTEMYVKATNEADAGTLHRAGTPHRAGLPHRYEVTVNGQQLIASVDLAHQRRHASGAVGASGTRRHSSPEHRADPHHGAGEVRAPMPGLIVAVLVDVGERVEEGQPLLTQESMKMQMQVRAPRAGRVTELVVSAGEQVAKEALLVRVTDG